jgi:hypothetical protein
MKKKKKFRKIIKKYFKIDFNQFGSILGDVVFFLKICQKIYSSPHRNDIKIQIVHPAKIPRQVSG